MGKIQEDTRIDQVLKKEIQMPAQEDSTAEDVPTLVADHNALLQKLRDLGLMKEE